MVSSENTPNVRREIYCDHCKKSGHTAHTGAKSCCYTLVKKLKEKGNNRGKDGNVFIGKYFKCNGPHEKTDCPRKKKNHGCRYRHK